MVRFAKGSEGCKYCQQRVKHLGYQHMVEYQAFKKSKELMGEKQ